MPAHATKPVASGVIQIGAFSKIPNKFFGSGTAARIGPQRQHYVPGVVRSSQPQRRQQFLDFGSHAGRRHRSCNSHDRGGDGNGFWRRSSVPALREKGRKSSPTL